MYVHRRKIARVLSRRVRSSRVVNTLSLPTLFSMHSPNLLAPQDFFSSGFVLSIYTYVCNQLPVSCVCVSVCILRKARELRRGGRPLDRSSCVTQMQTRLDTYIYYIAMYC